MKKIALWLLSIFLFLFLFLIVVVIDSEPVLPISMLIVISFLYYKLVTANKKIKEYDGINLKLIQAGEKNENYEEEIRKYVEKYSVIIDVDSAVDNAKSKLLKINSEIVDIQEQYKQKRAIYYDLIKQVSIFDERLNFAEMGVYEPHFDFDTSEDYRDRIKEIRDKQKEMIREKSAISCSIEWTVAGSKVEGRKMTDRGIRLTARAFNNECDAAIANVSWNNIERMEKRIEKAFEAINKMNETNQISISPTYLKLKLDELRLAFEYKEKRQIEKEEQAELRRQEREEEQLKKEAERALAEEKKLEKLLLKVQERATHSEGIELEKLKAEIAKLGDELKDMQKASDRVKAMAEQTKLGYVYVISNIGSFGKDVYKIGLTRRLEPMDRIKELGDASVPFYFDVHAMVFSKDAPALEAKIQRAFADRRLNLVNYRKEYFHVTLDEIKKEVWDFDSNVEFIDDTEAREYRESVAMRSEKESVTLNAEIPEEI